MPEVVFIGLGLKDESGITLEGLEEASRAKIVFAEFYTNTMPRLKIDRLEELLGKKILVLTRKQLEDENAEQVLKATSHGNVAFLIPGDPMIATTHVSLRLSLARKGILSRIVHNASIASAIAGATGLQSYKFGKSVTLPNAEGPIPGSVTDAIGENRSRRLHTLLLLDVKLEQGKQLTIKEALRKLIDAVPEARAWLVIGAARIGSPDQMVRAARMNSLAGFEFGNPPHALVFPGKLHFVEAEALKMFCGASALDLEEDL